MNIKRIIKARGYNQKTLAQKMNINRVTLADMIDGNPTVKSLQKIADALDCKMVDFFMDELGGQSDGKQNICPHCGKPINITLS